MVPRRRVPRPFNNAEHLADNLNENVLVQPLPAQSRIQHVLLTLRDTLQTTFNLVGICRLYPCHPSFEPNRFIPSSLLANSCPVIIQATNSPAKIFLPPYPFPNMTVYHLMSWMNSGSHQKSETGVQQLVRDVLQANDFDIKHLEAF
jgi:hypothetical protein